MFVCMRLRPWDYVIGKLNTISLAFLENIENSSVIYKFREKWLFSVVWSRTSPKIWWGTSKIRGEEKQKKEEKEEAKKKKKRSWRREKKDNGGGEAWNSATFINSNKLSNM